MVGQAQNEMTGERRRFEMNGPNVPFVDPIEVLARCCFELSNGSASDRAGLASSDDRNGGLRLAHHCERRFKEAGVECRLFTPHYVSPFVKTNKNDRNDAEAIIEAAVRPSMNFVAVKSVEQHGMQQRSTYANLWSSNEQWLSIKQEVFWASAASR
jgi:hypothetical protein